MVGDNFMRVHGLLTEYQARIKSEQARAAAATPGEAESAPLSYVTAAGAVRLHPSVMKDLGIPGGGGAMFHDSDTEGVVEIMSDKTWIRRFGIDEEELKRTAHKGEQMVTREEIEALDKEIAQLRKTPLESYVARRDGLAVAYIEQELLAVGIQIVPGGEYNIILQSSDTGYSLARMPAIGKPPEEVLEATMASEPQE